MNLETDIHIKDCFSLQKLGLGFVSEKQAIKKKKTKQNLKNSASYLTRRIAKFKNYLVWFP